MKVLLVTNDSQVFKTKEETDPVPARDMFGGRFTEVGRFGKRLSDIVDASLMIVSAKHGLIDGSFSISPYDMTAETRGDILALDERTDLIMNLKKRMQEHGLSILLLPKEFIRLLIERGALEIDSKVIAVTSKDFKSYFDVRTNCDLMERRGARLGRKNASLILDIVKRSLL